MCQCPTIHYKADPASVNSISFPLLYMAATLQCTSDHESASRVWQWTKWQVLIWICVYILCMYIVNKSTCMSFTTELPSHQGRWVTSHRITDAHNILIHSNAESLSHESQSHECSVSIESRSETDFQTETETGLYQSPNVWPICDICDGHKLSQIWICDRIFSLFFFLYHNRFGQILVTNVTNGHTWNWDWYKPVSVSVSIEMVRNERNTGKDTRK